MSYKVIEWARQQKTPDYTSRYVLLELAYFANFETRLCCPSLATLCDATQIKKKDTVRSAIDRLISCGLLSKWHERGDQGQIVRTRYVFPDEAFLEKENGVSRNKGQVSPQKDQVSPEKVQGVSPETEGGVPSEGGRVSPEKGRNREIEQGNEQVNISCQNSSEVSLNSIPEEEANPQIGVDPKLGGSPQNEQGVAPKMGAFKQPQNGGGNREVEKEIEKELLLSREICDEVIYEFTVRCPDLPKVASVTEPRKRLIKARLKDVGLETLLATFDRVHRSDWLCGRIKDWRADFNWVMKRENFVKITEGNFDNRKSKARVDGPFNPPDDYYDGEPF